MKKVYILASLFCVLVTLNLQTACNAANPMETKKDNSLNEFVAGYLDTSVVRGISVAVYLKDKQTIQTAVAGCSHEGTPVTADMIWGIGSNSKTFAAVLCFKLEEKGLLSVSDPIGKYLPTMKNIDPSITIKQLLQHQSGLADIFDNHDFTANFDTLGTRRWSPEEVLQYLPAPFSKPGAEGKYTATNYILASMIIEKVTGMSFAKAVHHYLLKPFKLNHTYVGGFDKLKGPIAHPVANGRDVSDEPRIAINTCTMAAACMYSNPSQMVRWYQALFNDGFLSEHSLNEFTSFIPWTFDKYYDYVGCGIFKIKHNGHVYYGHGGWVYGYFSFSLYDIETGNTINVMTNQSFDTGEKLAYDVADYIRQQ